MFLSAAPTLHPDEVTRSMVADREAIRERYLRFARDEARGRSSRYEALTLAIARNDELLDFVAGLPFEKQQPNLVLAATRAIAGVPRNADALGRAFREHGPEIRALALERRTQTNEPARCAVLLPVLCRLPPPLALLEVGASAGLCLLPDHYAYRYGDARITPPGSADAPTFECEASAATPLPTALPTVVWRAGIDLEPVDATAKRQLEWLELLIWPEHSERLSNLRRALNVARRVRPRIHRGDLFDALPQVAAKAPKGATLVVFHSAVLTYVRGRDVRDGFAQAVKEVGATWISNEAPGVLPSVEARLAVPVPADKFVLAVDGVPVAFTGPHGQSIDWLA